MARITLISITDKPSHNREGRPTHHHDDDKQIIPGWAKHREPLIEPPAANKNLHLGQWLTRATANSGPKIAPGTGIKEIPPGFRIAAFPFCWDRDRYSHRN
jgi:hypothetical protein